MLLVEDNPADVRLILEALAEAGHPRDSVHVCPDGATAMGFLRRDGDHSRAPRPDLVLLDLNLPGKGGQEVLTEVKTTPNLRNIPVVVLTTSQAHKDVCAAYSRNANCYVCKPIGLDEFIDVVKSTAKFWLRTVELPDE